MSLLQEGDLQVKDLDYWVSTIESRWKDIPEFKVDPENFKHLAIICDGNRRSAKLKGLHPWEGHRLGLEVIRGIMQAGHDWGIKHLTFWTWSTENWKRDTEQIGFVMGLAAKYLRDEEAISPIIKNQVRFHQIGRSDRLPTEVREAIIDLEERTSGFNEYHVWLGLDYGGRDEVSRAAARMIEEGLRPEDVSQNPDLILDYLDTAGQPVPDLVIRTGITQGEIPHTSGFMPIQTAYSGWDFDDELFPDLTPIKLLKSIQTFIDYERRQGK